jgi:hypothetical protein
MMVLPLLTGKTIFTTKDTTLAPHASAGEQHEGKTKKTSTGKGDCFAKERLAMTLGWEGIASLRSQ